MSSMRVTIDAHDGETVTVYGTATSPGAGTAVATLAAASLTGGLYDIEVYVAATGTVAAATETDNMEFREGATVVGKTPIIITGTSASSAYVGPYAFRRRLDGTAAVTVNATAAGTALSVYRAQIKATKVAG